MSDCYDIHEFTLNIHGGYDANNLPLTITTANKKGFIEKMQRVTVDSNGENVLSSANIYLDYLPSVTLEDTITFDGKTWNIISIGEEIDFTNRKTRLYLQ